MDNRIGNPDRADPLRSLSLSLARGKLQMVQSSLLKLAAQAAGPHIAGERGKRAEDGCAPDLTARCEVCGEALGPSRADRQFCNQHCYNQHYRRLGEIERLQSNGGRPCVICGNEIPPSKRADAKYCGPSCAGSTKNLNKRPAVSKTCLCCGQTFRPFHLTQVYCSVACANAVRWDESRAVFGLARLTAARLDALLDEGLK